MIKFSFRQWYVLLPVIELSDIKLFVRAAVILCILFVGTPSIAQPVVKKDTTIILLSDINVQIESTKALDDLYNFKFDAAENQFGYLRIKYQWHPLPYFLMGLIEWWKIMPDPKNTDHDEMFLAYMDSTIMLAENLYKHYPAYKVEASFFLAAAYGFKGRLYSEDGRENWTKAAWAGKNALDYLEVSKEYNDLSPEFLFGDALFNYFSVWVRENYRSLRPLLWLFPKGDKALGLKQLKEVSYNAFYTRVEAMVWLMRILNSYENDQERAFQIGEYLYTLYPDNPYFHRYYARLLYYNHQFSKAEPVCKEILARIDSGMVGYESTSGRYATFFLGQIYEARKDDVQARKYYEECVHFSEVGKDTKSGYYLYSMISLGEIAQREGRNADAKQYFSKVKNEADRKDVLFKDAKKRLKELERKE